MDTNPASLVLETLSETEIVSRIAGGDATAFQALMRRYNRRLFRVARAILNDDSEAEEALQEAYLIAYKNLSKFRGDAKLSTWLTRVVVNEALQRLRKNKRERNVIPFASLEADEETMNANAETKPETPEKATLRAEMRQLLEREIGKLPVSFRAVFILREIEDLTVEETAECLELPAVTVRTRLFRAKALLREALAKEIDVATAGAFDFAGQRCERIVERVLDRIPMLTRHEGNELPKP